MITGVRGRETLAQRTVQLVKQSMKQSTAKVPSHRAGE
jgi:hypothetical protein